VLECVIHISEGRRPDVIEAIGRAAGPALLDVHTDPDHHRSVLTTVGEDAARSVAGATFERLDLRDHHGVHPRIGVLDVVPFVPLGGADPDEALAARNRFAHWLADEHGVPSFLYGPDRTLPEVRRLAAAGHRPDVGPAVPPPATGAVAVGARELLVAYNLWLAEPDLERARTVARELRGPAVRTLALVVGAEVQVSMNLIDPAVVGPAEVYDAVAATTAIGRAELVGLVPEVVLQRTDPTRWAQLDLALDRTIEARLLERDLVAPGWSAWVPPRG
jgi:glutamate formiminotransferase